MHFRRGLSLHKKTAPVLTHGGHYKCWANSVVNPLLKEFIKYLMKSGKSCRPVVFMEVDLRAHPATFAESCNFV